MNVTALIASTTINVRRWRICSTARAESLLQQASKRGASDGWRFAAEHRDSDTIHLYVE
jgi:hypothetical protein